MRFHQAHCKFSSFLQSSNAHRVRMSFPRTRCAVSSFSRSCSQFFRHHKVNYYYTIHSRKYRNLYSGHAYSVYCVPLSAGSPGCYDCHFTLCLSSLSLFPPALFAAAQLTPRLSPIGWRVWRQAGQGGGVPGAQAA